VPPYCRSNFRDPPKFPASKRTTIGGRLQKMYAQVVQERLPPKIADLLADWMMVARDGDPVSAPRMKEVPATPRTGAPWKGCRPRGHAASRSWCPWSVRACWERITCRHGFDARAPDGQVKFPNCVPGHLCAMIAARNPLHAEIATRACGISILRRRVLCRTVPYPS
jgi:hypothetical protein